MTFVDGALGGPRPAENRSVISIAPMSRPDRLDSPVIRADEVLRADAGGAAGADEQACQAAGRDAAAARLAAARAAVVAHAHPAGRAVLAFAGLPQRYVGNLLLIAVAPRRWPRVRA